MTSKQKWKVNKSRPDKEKEIALLGKKMINSEIVRLNVRIPSDTYDNFKIKCIGVKKSMSEIINHMVLNFIEKK